MFVTAAAEPGRPVVVVPTATVAELRLRQSHRLRRLRRASCARCSGCASRTSCASRTRRPDRVFPLDPGCSTRPWLRSLFQLRDHADVDYVSRIEVLRIHGVGAIRCAGGDGARNRRCHLRSMSHRS